MMRALLLLLVGCGAQAPTLSATINVTGLTAADLQSMEVYVLASETSSGAALDCPSLQGAPLSVRTDLVTHSYRFLSFGDTHLDEIVVGEHLIIAVNTYSSANGTGSPSGFGCVGDVAMKRGQNTTVIIDIVPF